MKNNVIIILLVVILIGLIFFYVKNADFKPKENDLLKKIDKLE